MGKVEVGIRLAVEQHALDVAVARTHARHLDDDVAPKGITVSAASLVLPLERSPTGSRHSTDLPIASVRGRASCQCPRHGRMD